MTVALTHNLRHLFAVRKGRLTFVIIVVAMTLSPMLSGVAVGVA